MSGFFNNKVDAASVTAQINSVNTQLVETMNTKIRTCKQLGMIKDSSTEGENNFNLLINAINNGFNIHVDGRYHLSTLQIKAVTSFINLIGISNDAEFILNSGGSYFEIMDSKKVEMKNIKITNIQSSLSILFSLGDTKCEKYLDDISVFDCEFNGNISLLRSSVGKTVNPLIQKYGIGFFTLNNNKVKNTNYSFITLQDVPVDTIKVDNNKVNNFSFVFLHSGISNDHLFANELYTAKRKIIVKNNEVYCSDNYWGSYLPGNSYYCFILAEGEKCIYTGNHIEGLKIKENVATYDSYLSVADLQYENNTWINNICFNPNKSNNVLLKSKGGKTINGSVKRVYRNNTYKVTKDFADRTGELPENLYIYLIDIENNVDSYVIDSNNFEIYELLGANVTRSVKKMTITNNTINGKYMSGGFPMIQVNAGVDYTDALSLIKGNVIKAENISSKLNYPVQLFGMSDLSSGSNVYSTVIIEDNHVISTNPNLFANGMYCNQLLTNNNILETSGLSRIDVGIGKINNYVNTNSKFVSKDNNFEESRYTFGACSIEEKYSIKSIGANSSWRGLQLTRNQAADNQYKYIRRYEFITKDQHYKFDFTFIYGYDAATGFNYVIFTDVNGVEVRADLYKGATGNGQQNATKIKLNFDKGSGFEVRFDNYSTRSAFIPISIPNEFVICNVETLSFKI